MDQITEFLAGIQGVVEATNEEQHSIWERHVHRPPARFTWEQMNPGLGPTIGQLRIEKDSGKHEVMPVCISLFKVKIDGRPILFYHATSQVVDHRMVDRWLDDHIPQSAYRDGRINKADATNFINVVHRLERD